MSYYPKSRLMHGETGDTAPRAPAAWLVEGNHTELEDAILDKVDVEKGHILALMRERLRPEQKKHSLGQDYEIVATPALERELYVFLDYLTEGMLLRDCDANAQRISSATRAYAVTRPILKRLESALWLSQWYKRRQHISITHEGAHALLVQLRSYLECREEEPKHDPLRTLLKALREGKKLTKGRT